MRELNIHCDVPAKLVVKAEPRRAMDIDDSKYGVNEKNSRVSQNSMEITRDKKCRKNHSKNIALLNS